MFYPGWSRLICPVTSRDQAVMQLSCTIMLREDTARLGGGGAEAEAEAELNRAGHWACTPTCHLEEIREPSSINKKIRWN